MTLERNDWLILDALSDDYESVEQITSLIRDDWPSAPLEITNETRSENQEITISINLDANAIGVGLIKIAYLAAFEFLGDDFLDDPLNAEWQKSIRATSPEELENIQIRRDGLGAIPPPLMRALFPPLEPHDCGCEALGNDALSQYCMLSETSSFGLNTLEGKIVICDSLTKAVRVEPFDQHFRRISNVLGPNLPDPPGSGAPLP